MPLEDTRFDALHESWAIQESVSARGFDWPDITGVFEKVAEELCEVREAHAGNDIAHAQREVGDLLFSVVNLARFLSIHPNDALATANARFLHRFSLLERELERDGRRMETCTLAELDAIWERVKEQVRADEAAGRTP